MKVQSINIDYKNQLNMHKTNNINFKGVVKCKILKDLMTKTPEMILDKYEAKTIHPNKIACLLDQFLNAFNTITNTVEKLNKFSTLETKGDKVREVVLKNAYSEYVEPLNFKFAEKCDDFNNEVFRAEGYKIANVSIEENVDILTDLADCLEKVDFHGVEAKMVLHSDNPSCIRDAIRETYKNEVK